MNTGLNSYKKKIHSQWGEDGILDEIFKRIGTTNRFCVEFGAGDGYECSNVWHLIRNEKWDAILMEPDADRHKKWATLAKEVPQMKIIDTLISIDGKNSLDAVLERNGVPIDLDLLSIDIDSDDHNILRSMKKYLPRVLIIEHNPTIPPGDAIVQTAGETERFGASASANVELAHDKGYFLAAATQTNCIFVRGDTFFKLSIKEPLLEEVFDRSGLSYIISAYNGSLYFKGANKECQPAFGWIYRGWNISFFRSFLHAFVLGPIFNAKDSRTLASRYRPLKALFSTQANKKP